MIRELALELAVALREEVLPELGSHGGRAHVGRAQGIGRDHSSKSVPGEDAGGDVTFAIDERAETFMEAWLAERAPGVAFYSEDRGMVDPSGGEAEWVLVVDPIDGTRPAMAGFESCCVSIAAAKLTGEPTMADVEVGAVVEIKSGERFLSERGAGVAPEPRLSPTTEIERMMWTYGLRGRPAKILIGVLEELIDRSSVGGASFDLGSASYDMTRIATGQLDAYIEPGPRIVEEVPGAKEEFERVGGGAILNNTPYDIAASALHLKEAGAIVTDAWGRPLDDRPLLGSGPSFQMSCVAAANAELHVEILASIERGMKELQ